MAEVLICENRWGFIIAFEFICFISSQGVNYIKSQKLIVKLQTAAVWCCLVVLPYGQFASSSVAA
jgi:hypothetical protein